MDIQNISNHSPFIYKPTQEIHEKEVPKYPGSSSISGGPGGGVGVGGFASEIGVRAPNFASKIIDDKYPKFCP